MKLSNLSNHYYTKIEYPLDLPPRNCRIHTTAVISEKADIRDGVSIGMGSVIKDMATVLQGAIIGEGVTVGEGSTIGAKTHVEDNTVIGDVCNIGHDVLIQDSVTIEDRVTVDDHLEIGYLSVIGTDMGVDSCVLPKSIYLLNDANNECRVVIHE